jgi:predicted nucleic acid-binding protein
MRYLDTSVVVAAITNEPDTKAAQRALGPGDDLAISDWTLTEVASALSIKQRTRSLTGRDRDQAAKAFEILVATSLMVLPVNRSEFVSAAAYLADPTTGLRAGDALHLAVLSAAGATLHTFDRSFAAAARKLGSAAVLVR